MSQDEKDKRSFFLNLMKAFVEHWIGNNDIAKEARTFVSTLEREAMRLTNDEFQAHLVKWDTILNQAPEWLYRKYAKSGVNFRYASRGHGMALSA